jgi:hypothetical protein
MVMKRKYLATYQGVPVSDNQNSLTVGQRGPVLLQDAHLIEISHPEQGGSKSPGVLIVDSQANANQEIQQRMVENLSPTSSLAGVY